MEVIKRNENISFQTLEESNSQTFCLFPCFRTGAAVLECSLDMTEFDHSIRFSDIRLWNSIARITDAHAHHCTSSGFQKFCPPCFLFLFFSSVFKFRRPNVLRPPCSPFRFFIVVCGRAGRFWTWIIGDDLQTKESLIRKKIPISWHTLKMYTT